MSLVDINSASDPDDYFDSNGLKVQTLAGATRRNVRLAKLDIQRNTRTGDDSLWHYRHGVYLPTGAAQVEAVASKLLGERARTSHVSHLLLKLRTSDLDTLGDGPPHPDLINFTDRMVEWSTLRVLDHDPSFKSTVQLAVPWSPDALCPLYDKWVTQMLPADCGDYSDELGGYLMMNGNPFHKAIMGMGSGRNGKGTLMRFSQAIMGRSNFSSVPLQTLAENRFATAQLYMKLANFAGDLSSRHIEDTSQFKMSIGADPIYAEHKNGQPFSFTSWAVPFFSANQIPSTPDTSQGYFSKWEVQPFPVNLLDPGIGVDPLVEAAILATELPGIAARYVRGLQRLMERGRFDRPPSVQEAFRRFVRESDQARAWIEDRCWTDADLQPGDPPFWSGPRAGLYDDYKQWTGDEGLALLSPDQFYRRLDLAGYQRKERQGIRGFVGIAIKNQAGPENL